MFRRPSTVARLLVLLSLVASLAQAHDYWLLPSSFTPQPGEVVAVRHRVGQSLAGDPVPRNPKLLQRFEWIGPDGKATPIAGTPGMDPAGAFRAGAPGTTWILYEGDRSFVVLPPPRVEEYAAAEGLEWLVAERKKRGEAEAPSREAFSRDAKAAICVGAPADPQRARSAKSMKSAKPAAFGLRAELVPEHDPCGFRVGGRERFTLLFRGKPAAGVLVQALSGSAPETPVRARTDKNGRVELRLDRPGLWLVKAVQLVAAQGLPDADWESFWPSITFEIATPDAPGK